MVGAEAVAREAPTTSSRCASRGAALDFDASDKARREMRRQALDNGGEIDYFLLAEGVDLGVWQLDFELRLDV
jgi:hypothetical protein